MMNEVDAGTGKWHATGRLVVTFFGERPLVKVRLIGACDEVIDEFWAAQAPFRTLLSDVVAYRKGARK